MRIAAGEGFFTLAGADVSLIKSGAFVLPAGAGNFALSGSDAVLKASRQIAGNVGAFNFSGADAALKRNARIAAGFGSFDLNGSDATLKHLRKLLSDAGEFIFSGTDAAPKRGARLRGEAGSYIWSGAAADLVFRQGGFLPSPSFPVSRTVRRHGGLLGSRRPQVSVPGEIIAAAQFPGGGPGGFLRRNQPSVPDEGGSAGGRFSRQAAPRGFLRKRGR